MEALAASIGRPNSANVSVEIGKNGVPMAVLRITEGARISALELARALIAGQPSIRANPDRVDDDILSFGPLCLRPGEAEIVGRRVAALLG
jgi:hypothetical protein